MEIQYVQGDVLIKKVENIPTSCKKLPHLTLARGEVTFHHHTITKGNAELYEKNGTLYLCAKEKVELTHQEHDTIMLPKGNYEIGIVREYLHFTEEAKRVQD